MTEIKIAANLNHYKNDQMNRVYDITGIAPTALVVSGGGRELKIMERGDYGLRKLKANDLFCGAGGMGLGFKNAGFEIAGAWDFDKYAVQSYKHNVGDHVQQADISQMDEIELPNADVWTFGFPCQDLSVAGKQAGLFEGKRSGLFFEVMRLLDERSWCNRLGSEMPKIIMAENVKGLKPYLNVLREEYEKRGYKMYYTLYNSKFWGVPQNRERYFVIGVHESIEKVFEFPIQQEYYIPRLSTVLEEEVDEKYYLSEKLIAGFLKHRERHEEKGTGFRWKVRDENGVASTLRANGALCPTDNTITVKEATKKGYAEATIGDSVNISHPNSKTRRGRVGKQVAQTLLTGQEQVVYEEPYRIRKLTPREYARLQGFPESYEIIVSNSQAYKQAGNAVSVPVAQAIAERIRMFLLSL